MPYFYHSFLFAAAFKKVMPMVVEKIKKQYKDNQSCKSAEECASEC